MRKLIATFLLGISTGAGCATVPPCPKAGGPAWSELRTTHFVVRTDLDAEDANELARELEEMRAIILAVGWSGAPEPLGTVDVVTFRSARELAAMVPDGVDGVWLKLPPFNPTLLVAGVGGTRERLLVAHEVTLDLAHRFLPLEPPWFSEGIATFFETLSYDRASHSASVGMPPRARFDALATEGVGDSSELIKRRALPERPNELAAFENQSWLLFHYLVDHRTADLAKMQDLLRQLTPWDRAFEQAFPDLSAAHLEAELAEYLRSRRIAFGTRTIKVDVGPIQTRALADAEVHALRGYLFAAITRTRARANAEIDEALAQEPANVSALAATIYLRDATDDTKRLLAERAIAAHPTSWLAAVSYADAAGASAPGAKSALLRALPDAPAQPQLLSRLAHVEAAEGRWEQALAFADRAIHLGEGNDLDLLTAYVTSLAHVQRCGEAASVANAVDGLIRAQNHPERARLHTDVERICRAAATP
jgi:hypothetical protein